MRTSVLRKESKRVHKTSRCLYLPQFDMASSRRCSRRFVDPSPCSLFFSTNFPVTTATTDIPFVFTPPAPATGPFGAAPRSPAAGIDPLVEETRREISEIVREVAGAVRSNLSRPQFFNMLADRVMRAMAAKGVVIWTIDETPDLTITATQRVGTITDRSISKASEATHQQLLAHITIGGEPVVVPPTPEATDANVPSNPSSVPAAVVPCFCDPTSPMASHLIEVFLEPDCGISTQRGYLRFVAQMADLAGEFLRNDQLRHFQQQQKIADQTDAAILAMHRAVTSAEVLTTFVDRAREIFGFDRVGLCTMHQGEAILVAVSHISTIDKHSDAAKQIIATAESHYMANGYFEIEQDSQDKNIASLKPVLVLNGDEQSRLCLVCLAADPSSIDSVKIAPSILRLTQHAGIAAGNQRNFEAIPGGKWFASLATQTGSRLKSGRWLGRMIRIAMLTCAVLVACFPVPMMVTTTASLRATNVQTLYAPRSAVVKEIHVQHGDIVRAGDAILTMHDPDLQQQITSLYGRRAVLSQKQSALTAALVDTTSYPLDRNAQLQGERSLVAEELHSIDEQLVILKQVSESLVLRALHDGVVDGWQIEQQLSGRPVARGDELLEVIATKTDWLVDAHVPLSRISPIQSAASSDLLRTTIVTEGVDKRTLTATLDQFGPVIQSAKDGTEMKAIVLKLNTQDNPLIGGDGPVNGSPVRVLFRCETRPAIEVLFFDAMDSLRSTIGLYWGS